MSLVDQLRQTAPQGSEQWAKLRLGKFTASEIYRLMTEPKTKEAKERGDLSDGAMTYVRECVAETLTGEYYGDVWSKEIEWGEEHEGAARELFEQKYGVKVTLVGSYIFDEMPNDAAGSPDGEVEGESAIIEIKAPFNMANHVRNLLYTKPTDLEKEYYYQMQANMLFGGKSYGYFISYDPRMPDKYQLKVLQVPSNKEVQEALWQKLKKAASEKSRMIEVIKNGKP